MPRPPALDASHVLDAARRLHGVVERTPLAPFPGPDPRVELRLKLECLQVVGAFKARGAWNHVAQLGRTERARGVVTSSSGNHGKALAWAAARAGIAATVCMPADAYASKIAACRDYGAEVVLGADRAAADTEYRARVAAGAVGVPPYDHARTIAGQGTVALDVLEQWPDVDVLVAPVGGGGLLAGCALFLEHHARATGHCVRSVGVEPEGAATLSAGLAAGESVTLASITSAIQGLTPPNAGALNVAVCRDRVAGVFTLPDDAILAAQARLVREGGWVVEPAGGAATAWVLGGGIPEAWLEGRSESNPLHVAAIVSGGNPDPAQYEALVG